MLLSVHVYVCVFILSELLHLPNKCFLCVHGQDYQDAFQKVLQLGLKGQQEREIVVVAVECCKQESQFNPFYSYLMERLATHDRRFMVK